MKAQNTRKSSSTKRTLAETLKRLLTERPFGEITVSDLLSACGMSRKTFYYHFQDLMGLLRWTLEKEAEELSLLGGHTLSRVMVYTEDHSGMMQNICHSQGRGEAERFFALALSKTAAVAASAAPLPSSLPMEIGPKDYREFLHRFYAHALSGILLDWLEQGGDPARTAALLEAAIQE